MHSAWVAERSFDLELDLAHETAGGLHSALSRIVSSISVEERLGVLTAHPDLEGKLVQAKRLTLASTSGQAFAGLDALTDAEQESFAELNQRYTLAFGFSIVISERDHDNASILRAYQRRIE